MIWVLLSVFFAFTVLKFRQTTTNKALKLSRNTSITCQRLVCLDGEMSESRKGSKLDSHKCFPHVHCTEASSNYHKDHKTIQEHAHNSHESLVEWVFARAGKCLRKAKKNINRVFINVFLTYAVQSLRQTTTRILKLFRNMLTTPTCLLEQRNVCKKTKRS